MPAELAKLRRAVAAEVRNQNARARARNGVERRRRSNALWGRGGVSVGPAA